MKIISSAFQNNQFINNKYTCDGPDINPPLEFQDIPKNTESLVLIVDDPDAIKPAGKVWDHWIIFNIPPETKKISENKEPSGIHGIGTSNNLNYHGPCPPDAEHRYFFKLYALDKKLDLVEGTTKPEIESAMKNNIIDQAELIGLYKR